MMQQTSKEVYVYLRINVFTEWFLWKEKHTKQAFDTFGKKGVRFNYHYVGYVVIAETTLPYHMSRVIQSRHLLSLRPIWLCWSKFWVYCWNINDMYIGIPRSLLTSVSLVHQFHADSVSNWCVRIDYIKQFGGSREILFPLKGWCSVCGISLFNEWSL